MVQSIILDIPPRSRCCLIESNIDSTGGRENTRREGSKKNSRGGKTERVRMGQEKYFEKNIKYQ
jgi:hypothetical protein